MISAHEELKELNLQRITRHEVGAVMEQEPKLQTRSPEIGSLRVNICPELILSCLL